MSFINKIINTSVNIGGGKQANVYKFKLNDSYYVIKVYDTYENREGVILQKYACLYMPQCYEWGYYDSKYYVIMDFIEGGQVRNINDNIKRQLFDFLNIIKDMNLQNREIRPEHILITHEEKVKVIDWGWASTPEYPIKVIEPTTLNEKYSIDDQTAIEMIIKELSK